MKTANKMLLTIFIIAITHFAQLHANAAVPVVIWHGMGDSCCFSFSMGKIAKLIEQEIPDIYVHSVRIGKNEVEDVENSYMSNVNLQVKKVCTQIQNDTALKNGYHAIGFSQGAQFLRALAQRCPWPRMKKLISIGGQHQGVFGLPHCTYFFCNYIRNMLNYAAYTSFVQQMSVQAEYWHNPYEENAYKNKNIFLADINNEKTINQDYINNLQKLEKFVLVKFENDSMVVPVETEWFGFFKPGQSKQVLPMEETELYLQDRLGLKMMNENGQLDFISLEGDHLQFTEDWFIETIVRKYLI